MDGYPLLEVKVWGEYACFTRPEMKVERVTYPVITPSAARGVLEAIFWKPEFRWRIHEVIVLNEISYFSILRNEVNSRASESAAKARLKSGGGYFAEEDRAQRHTLGLRNVAYIVRADIEMRAHAEENPAKYRDQFRRRVARGQCFQQPYLGCREFVAYFGPVEPSDRPIDRSEDLGRILFDLQYQPAAQGRGEPHFFEAHLERGVLRVPPELYAMGA